MIPDWLRTWLLTSPLPKAALGALCDWLARKGVHVDPETRATILGAFAFWIGHNAVVQHAEIRAAAQAPAEAPKP